MVQILSPTSIYVFFSLFLGDDLGWPSRGEELGLDSWRRPGLAEPGRGVFFLPTLRQKKPVEKKYGKKKVAKKEIWHTRAENK
jgi:hypothetical protein